MNIIYAQVVIPLWEEKPPADNGLQLGEVSGHIDFLGNNSQLTIYLPDKIINKEMARIFLLININVIFIRAFIK